MRVYVYWNLHRLTYSIKALEGDKRGRVIAYRDRVVLYRPVCHVNERARQRVLARGRKEVHAGVVGDWPGDGVAPAPAEPWARVGYNPYKTAVFRRARDLAPVSGAALAYFDEAPGVYFAAEQLIQDQE